MREIKFRAWDLDNHEMYYSHLEESNGEDKIDWRIDCDGVFFEEIQIIDTCPGGKGHKQSREWRKPNQITMQYTGLKDKNGKEIYEGDVYGRYNYIYKVVWVQEKCCFMGLCFGRKKDFSEGFTKEHDGHLFPLGDDGIMEIIGNVHENPELIT